MAKDNSFDVVSQVDMQEVDNAFQQTRKELVQRYDLKGSGADIELDKPGMKVVVVAPSDFVGSQVIDVFNTRLVRRSVDLKSIRWADSQAASGGTVRIEGEIVAGIDQDTARKINKDIRDQKFSKVKVAIEGDKLRVSSPSRDELQAVIAFLKEGDWGVPLQYENYR